jgi:hypothetical protein
MQKIFRVKALGEYQAHLKFESGLSGILDFKSLFPFEGEVFQELKDPTYFAKIGVEKGTLRWPNETDICSDTLYSWMKKYGTHLVQGPKMRRIKILAAPIVSTFYGIHIEIRYREMKHELPHFHALYEKYEASISIKPLKVLENSGIPSKLLRIVKKWAAIHQEELLAGWVASKNHKKIKKIDPYI